MPAGESAKEPVLEALAENTVPVNPTVLEWYLAEEIDYRPPSRRTIQNALELLENENLVENPWRSYWRITDRGRAYLAGELEE